MGLTYTTAPASVGQLYGGRHLTDHTGTYPNTVKLQPYYHTRDNAGNVMVHHYEQGTTTRNRQKRGCYFLNGAGQLGLLYTTVVNKTIPHLACSAPTNKNGVAQPEHKSKILLLQKKWCENVLVHHYENWTTTRGGHLDENLSGVVSSTTYYKPGTTIR